MHKNISFGLRSHLYQSRQFLTPLPEEALEALARALCVVTKSATGAVHTVGAAISLHWVEPRRALALRAVCAAEACVALAAVRRVRVKPRVSEVGIACRRRYIGDEIRLALAYAVTRAVVGASRALAGVARVTRNARARARRAVAEATTRALEELVRRISIHGVELQTVIRRHVQEVAVPRRNF